MYSAKSSSSARRQLTSLLVSFSIHLGTGALLVSALPLCSDHKKSQMYGSEELDVDLVEPNLAPPVRRTGDGSQNQSAAARRSRQASLDVPRSSREKHEAKAPVVAAKPVKEAKRKPAKAESPEAPPKAPREAPPRAAQLPQEEKADDHGVPDGPSPGAVLASVQEEVDRRRALRRRAQKERRHQSAAAARQFAALSRRTGRVVHCSAGSFEGAEAAPEGDSKGKTKRGLSPHLGLKFYLSGRRVVHSRVVRPPEVVSMPHIRCKVKRLSITPATVRMLVETSGKVGHIYIKHSSGSTPFDRCAIRHAGKMRFRPGVDRWGSPLDVWINLRVEPSIFTAAL